MILVVGATGFIGTHLIKALRAKGISARCLLRSPGSQGICAGPGLAPVRGDITDPGSLQGALHGIHTVVNLAGIIAEKGGQTFREIHVLGVNNLLREAKLSSVRHFFHQSALGADRGSKAVYHRTKAEGEEAVRASGIPYTIFRPSLVVGRGDGFTTRLMDMLKAPGPFVPVPGSGKALFQPLYVGDWVECFLRALDNPDAAGRVYELGGPEQISFNSILEQTAEAMGVRKRLVHIPMGLAGLGVRLLEKTPLSPATSEQLQLLDTDNICDPGGVRKDFGFDPMPFARAIRLII
jgi:NADH dehydrogenase